MNAPPELTPAALAYLDGRDVHVRPRPHHGCCGGSAAIPTAEAGTPTDLDGLQRFDVAHTSVYVDSDLNPNDQPWTIDVDGFARWQRLVVVGLDMTTIAESCITPPVAANDIEPPDDETLAALAKAIAHPARIAILRMLGQRETCVTGDVVAELPLAQSTISEHLRILREAGLIQGEIEGPRTRYCINTNGLNALHSGIATL